MLSFWPTGSSLHCRRPRSSRYIGALLRYVGAEFPNRSDARGIESDIEQLDYSIPQIVKVHEDTKVYKTHDHSPRNYSRFTFLQNSTEFLIVSSNSNGIYHVTFRQRSWFLFSQFLMSADRVDMTEKGVETWVEDTPVSVVEPREKSKLEQRLLLKMDLSIVPLLALSFFIAYMVWPPKSKIGSVR